MDQTNNKPKGDNLDNKDEQNSLQPLNQAPQAQSQPVDSGLIEPETNYSTMNNKSEENNASISESDSSEKQAENDNKNEITLPVSTQLNKDNELQQKPEPIKTEEASIQVGGDKKIELLKNTEGTYAPEQCIIHSQSEKKSENSPTNQNSQRVGSPDDDKDNKTTQVQIQVGVSLVDEPEKVISKAKQQRVLVNHEAYLKYLENYLKESKNQKLVLDDCYDEINKKRIALYSLYNVFKQYFKYYASFTKDFYEKCQKVHKQEKVEQMNKFLNIGIELKDGLDELAAFKRQTGDNYKIVYEFITTKVLIDLDDIYNKYVNSMNEALGQTNQKRNISRKIEDDFKKQGSKVQKMFNRLKQGKKQQQDFFIQLLKTIALERQYKQSIIEWGKQLIETRKFLVDLSQTCIIDIQFLLNNFKNQTNTLYGIQSRRSELIRKSRAEVEEQTHFAKLITLGDSDYIRSSLQLSLRKQVQEITDIAFEKFVQMPHFSHYSDQSNEFLQNMIVKTFSLKQSTEELVNTVSGRLVLYQKESLQCKQNIFVKHIKSATPMEDGTVEIELKVPGIIFSSKKATKIEFKDNDRAEQLICFLGQGQANS